MASRTDPRHAAVRARVRPRFVTALLAVAAAGTLLLPVTGGSAPGPRVMLAGVCVGLIFRHRRRFTWWLASFCTGAAILAMSGWSSAWEHYLSTGQPAWGNTATGWVVAAGVAGAVAAYLRGREQREMSQRLDALHAEIRRLSGRW